MIYYRDCVPIVEAAPGSLEVFLLEPADHEGPIIACTIWETEQDAIAYKVSGTAKEVVARVKALFAGPASLRSNQVHR